MKTTRVRQLALDVWEAITEGQQDMVMTIYVAFFLSLVYVFFRYVPVPLSSETFIWLFVAQADLSPAWFLAPLLHENAEHLLANTGQLLLYGIVVERRLSTKGYIVFLSVMAVLTTLIQVVQYNLQNIQGGMIGFSGVSMAVMGFATAYMFLYYLGRVEKLLVSPHIGRALFPFGVVWAVIQMVSDFYPGWSLSQEASGVVHLFGLLLGAGYALLKVRKQSNLSSPVKL